MRWSRAFGPMVCGSCREPITAGEIIGLVPVGKVGKELRRCYDCAAKLDPEHAADPPIELLTTQASLDGPGPRVPDVVTEGQLAQRNARKAAALERWRARRRAESTPPPRPPLLPDEASQ